MFNKEVPDWGVTLTSGGSETTRDPEKDVVVVEVPVSDVSPAEESFIIDFEEADRLNLVVYWDNTKVKVPINK
jgi:hypothetical protein